MYVMFIILVYVFGCAKIACLCGFQDGHSHSRICRARWLGACLALIILFIIRMGIVCGTFNNHGDLVELCPGTVGASIQQGGGWSGAGFGRGSVW